MSSVGLGFRVSEAIVIGFRIGGFGVSSVDHNPKRKTLSPVRFRYGDRIPMVDPFIEPFP